MFIVSFCLVFALVVCNGQRTIPCPGVGDPLTFSQLGLENRPKLGKILQHGYLPKLNNATKVTEVAPGFKVNLENSFSARPVRTINEDNCSEFTNTGHIFCGHRKQGLFTQKPWTYSGLLEEIARSKMAFDGFDYDLVPFYNPSYIEMKQDIDEFLTSEQCGIARKYYRNYFISHVCGINSECTKYNDDFLADISQLPDTPGDLAPYREFINTWGYGIVDRFYFGSATLKIEMLIDDQLTKRILYMGQIGGTGTGENNTWYTEDECADPIPVSLVYEDWLGLLNKGPVADAVQNVTAVRKNFLSLHMETLDKYDDEVTQNFNPMLDCDAFTPNPTKSPSSAPTTSPTSSPTSNPTRSPTVAGETYHPTSSPTSNPTRSPTVDGETYHPTSSPITDDTITPTSSPTKKSMGIQSSILSITSIVLLRFLF